MESKKPSPRKQTSLETANEMFKAAFLVKKTRFAEQNPHLTNEEINKKTAQYFRELAERDKW